MAPSDVRNHSQKPANTGVEMIRDSLDAVPDYAVPEGFSVRNFRPGDEESWIAIHQNADELLDVTRATFDEAFGYDAEALKDRCFFLVAPDGHDVGTGTAWYCTRRGLPYGRVHWICMVKEYQGRGLAKPLLSTVMKRLARSHDRGFLDTSTGRIPAIGLYLKFGFVPIIDSHEAAEAWRYVATRLSHPALEHIRFESGNTSAKP